MCDMQSVRVDDKTVIITLVDGVLKFEDIWLRDNCRCKSCYNNATFQRTLHIQDIPASKIISAEICNIPGENKNESLLQIKWDDNHVSTFSLDFLKCYHYPSWLKSFQRPAVLWKGHDVEKKVARVQSEAFLKTTSGATAVFKSLLDYGVAFIEGVTPDLKSTETVCEALGGVQRTLFGGMWEFSTAPDHADTAYTTLPLAPHNDSTYFTESTGLQVLHCIEHSNGTGGNTVLVDGFYGAALLRDNFPDHYDFLTRHVSEAEYLEPGHHHKHASRILNLDPVTRELLQVRFNVYDRSPVAFKDGSECRSYYAALKQLSTYYQSREDQWWLKLNPGTVLVMDNWRVLHGRSSFTGRRVLCGSYVARSDWRDRARVLGILN